MNRKKGNTKPKKHKFHKIDVTVIDTDIAKKTVIATAMENTMEWFDFGIYSYLVVDIYYAII